MLARPYLLASTFGLQAPLTAGARHTLPSRRYGSHVYIIHRRDSFRASKVSCGLIARMHGGGALLR